MQVPGAPGTPGGQGGNAPATPERDFSTIDTWTYDEFLLLVAKVIDKTDTFADAKLTPYVQRMRGKMDMDSKKFRLGDFAASYALFRDSRQDNLPPGAYNRRRDVNRGPRDWPASERVSWLTELLPYFGEDRWADLYGAVKKDLSWRDSENQKAGRILVPHFLNPNAENYYLNIKGLDSQMAATHFVGMAGIGPDHPITIARTSVPASSATIGRLPRRRSPAACRIRS